MGADSVCETGEAVLNAMYAELNNKLPNYANISAHKLFEFQLNV